MPCRVVVFKQILKKRVNMKILTMKQAVLSTLVMASLAALPASAETLSNKLLLTGGVSQVEGAAGGGLTPWAVIGGYGTNNEVGGNVHYTYVKTSDYDLDTYGFTIGLFDRVEFSVAEQSFGVKNLRKKVEAALPGAIGRNNLKQTIVGIKVRVAGEAVLDADTWMPQIAVGLQYKDNDEGDFVKSAVVGAKNDHGTDVYIAATKLLLDKNLLLNGTLRFTKANQFGLLGFGGDKHDNYQPMIELSTAYLLRKDLAIGAEYRMKPNNLRSPANDLLFGGANVVDLKEEDAFDVFVAYAPTKNISLTAAYAYLGNIATVKAVNADFGRQDGLYLSAQIGF